MCWVCWMSRGSSCSRIMPAPDTSPDSVASEAPIPLGSSGAARQQSDCSSVPRWSTVKRRKQNFSPGFVTSSPDLFTGRESTIPANVREFRTKWNISQSVRINCLSAQYSCFQGRPPALQIVQTTSRQLITTETAWLWFHQHEWQ